MSILDDHKNMAEGKFVLDAQKEFKSEAKRNKMLGLWAAALMNKNDAEAETYATSVIVADMEEAGDDDVFRKLRGDLTDAGVDMSDSGIRDKMAECLAAARAEIYGHEA
ncbi:MAG: DUF1476 domain-containing protein [Maricaulaceae bacterium]